MTPLYGVVTRRTFALTLAALVSTRARVAIRPRRAFVWWRPTPAQRTFADARGVIRVTYPWWRARWVPTEAEAGAGLRAIVEAIR